MPRFKFEWLKDDGSVLRVANHSADTERDALVKARGQMRVLGYNPFHHNYICTQVTDDVPKSQPKKRRLRQYEDVRQSAFWWLDT